MLDNCLSLWQVNKHENNSSVALIQIDYLNVNANIFTKENMERYILMVGSRE